MNYENKEKIARVLSEIINSENQSIVEKNKELEEWKKNNIPKIRKVEELERSIESKNILIKMLTDNIEIFMKDLWAELIDESWQDWCSETGESWWEEIVFWRFQEHILSLTYPQRKKEE